MRVNVRFIISLVLILLISWANVNFFGSLRHNKFPFVVNHAVHFMALLLTWAIGLLSWMQSDKWLQWLWNMAYLFVFVVLLGLVLLYGYNPSLAPFKLTATIFTMRNLFTGPLPFLVCYALAKLAGKNT